MSCGNDYHVAPTRPHLLVPVRTRQGLPGTALLGDLVCLTHPCVVTPQGADKEAACGLIKQFNVTNLPAQCHSEALFAFHYFLCPANFSNH